MSKCSWISLEASLSLTMNLLTQTTWQNGTLQNRASRTQDGNWKIYWTSLCKGRHQKREEGHDKGMTKTLVGKLLNTQVDCYPKGQSQPNETIYIMVNMHVYLCWPTIHGLRLQTQNSVGSRSDEISLPWNLSFSVSLSSPLFSQSLFTHFSSRSHFLNLPSSSW